MESESQEGMDKRVKWSNSARLERESQKKTIIKLVSPALALLSMLPARRHLHQETSRILLTTFNNLHIYPLFHRHL